MKSVEKVYEQIEKKLKIPKRVVRYYVTEKLIPQPYHVGREAFYDLKTSQLISRLRIIKMMQKHKYTNDEIRDILDKYKGKDMDSILTLLEAIEQYPIYPKNTEEGRDIHKNWVHWILQNEFFVRLEQGKLDTNKVSIADMAKAIGKWSIYQLGEYQQNPGNFSKKFRR